MSDGIVQEVSGNKVLAPVLKGERSIKLAELDGDNKSEEQRTAAELLRKLGKVDSDGNNEITQQELNDALAKADKAQTPATITTRFDEIRKGDSNAEHYIKHGNFDALNEADKNALKERYAKVLGFLAKDKALTPADQQAAAELAAAVQNNTFDRENYRKT